MKLVLPYRAPYNWPALIRFLAPRATPGVEQANPEFYRRVLPQGWVEVRPDAHNPHLNVRVEGPARGLTARLHRLFDTAAPVREIEQHLARSPRLAATVHRESGLRIPGAWDAFELTVRAVLGQQVTVKGATTLTGRLVERYGERTAHGMLFPSPDALLGQDLTVIGLPRARAATLSGVAHAFASAQPPATMAQLMALRGIGAWTAQYVAMRAFKDPDAFPASDLGLLRAAGPDVARQAEAWRPWRAYAAMHLWLEQH
ncbi:MAG: AlkA N-terminal domain-containing protein [Candidatus Sulfopaludibacter sp.]|nr:AlkA N-terminal domain-containing protein [Candidatus Sulfopaludibacter sp.]